MKIKLWLIKETEKARLYSKLPPDRHPTHEDEIWVPRSVIEHQTKLPDACCIVTVSAWWADYKNL